jgi:hypothetical protein
MTEMDSIKSRKVRAEIVGVENIWQKFWKNIRKTANRIKLIIAVTLDIIDFAIAWIPIVNEIWDIACFLILLLILKNKKLAFISLVELPLLGLPPFSIIDMFLPICTFVVMIDNQI